MSVFNGVPPYNGKDVTDWILSARLAINGMLNGKTNNTGTFTLAANVGSTTFTLAKGRMGIDTVIIFMPTTAHAATEFGAGTIYVSSRDVAANTFTVTHTNNAQTDRTFAYVLVG